MKKNVLRLSLLCLIAAVTAGFPASPASAKDVSGIKTVAVVSLSVSDVAGTVRVGSVGSTPVTTLIREKVNDMLADTENKLGKKWSVVKLSSFIDNAAYRSAGVERTLTVFVPQVNGKDMPVFTQVSKEIKSAQIAPEKAKDLCKALNVDAVVLIFSEWTSKTGGFVPTTKAVTKNILAVWDAGGNMVFKKRVDLMGKRTLGMSGVKAVNDQTIGEWADSYSRSLDKIIDAL